MSARRLDPDEIVAALERLPLPAFRLAADMTVTWLNAAALDLLGDVVGRRATDVVAPESTTVADLAFAQLLLGTIESKTEEGFLLRPDGRRVRVEASLVAVKERGRFVGIFGLARPDESARPMPPIHDLTSRQAEVLGHLARGSSTAQIAEALGVSVDTVRNHVRDLLKRLGAYSRLEVVVVAHERGLV